MTDALLQGLFAACEGPFDVVVHIGSGAAAPDATHAAGIAALWLVEGDPDTAADLRAATADRPGVLVREAVVLPRDGSSPWHRYNLRSLNGPKSAEPLQPLFPRLRQWASQEVSGIGVAALLQELLAQHPEATRCALLLDVPGQEVDLLEAIPDDLLQRFPSVAVRTAGAELGTDWHRPLPLATRLEAAYFRRRSLRPAMRTAWPVEVYQFDAMASRLASVEQERASAVAEVARLSEALRACEQELGATRAAGAAERQALAEDREQRLAQLQQLLDAAVARSAELEDARDGLTLQLAERDRERDDARARVETLTAELAELRPAHDRWQASAAQEAERVAALARERDEARAEVVRLGEALRSLETAHAELQSKADWRAKEILNLSHARDRATQDGEQALADARRQHEEALSAARTEAAAARAGEVARLEEELAQLRLRHRLTTEEIVRAEGQIDFIKDVLLRDARL